MDSAKDFFFGTRFHFFGGQNWPFFRGMVSLRDLRFHKSSLRDLRFHKGMCQFTNARMVVSNQKA